MNLRQFDLSLLITFATLFEERSVTEAARKLGVSQPTVSFSLNKLRQAIGDELFIRTAAGMQPTPRAEALLGPVRRIIETLETEILGAVAFDPSTSGKTFTLTMSDIGELVILPRVLDRLRQLAPHTSVRCVSVSPNRLIESLETGEVDLAVGYFPDLTGTKFYQQKLFEHPFTCLVRRDHDTIGATISLNQFLDAEHVVVRAEGRSQEIFEKLVQDKGLARRIVLHSPHFMSLPFIIANSDLISIAPQAVGYFWGPHLGLKMLKPPLDIPLIQLKQFWHKRFHADPINVWIRGLVAQLFLNRDPTRDTE